MVSPELALLRFRNHDHVDVVRHQAVGPDVHVPARAPLRHQTDVVLIIFFTEKGLLPAIAPLRDVMGQAWRHDPCESCHAARLWRPNAGYELRRVAPSARWPC